MTTIAERRTLTEQAASGRTSGTTWAGRVTSGLVILFLAVDAAGKLLRIPAVVEGTTALGYPASAVLGIGAVLALGVALYAVPRSCVLGAILLTGYLGGAVATNVRVGAPLATHVLFPVYVGILAWLGLFLRDARLRTLLPLRGRAGG